MCKLGNAEAARLKPPLKIATILGTSPLHEVARESEADRSNCKRINNTNDWSY